MKNISILALTLLSFARISAKTYEQYHGGIGVYPLANYELGKCIKVNYLITRKKHLFYIGINAPINNNVDLWSNTQNIYKGNGVATKTIHYFHPDIGYTKFIPLSSNCPVAFLINLDFECGKIDLSEKVYIYNPAISLGTGIDGEGYYRYINSSNFASKNFFYWQFTSNIGVKIDVTSRWKIIGMIGIGIASIQAKELNFGTPVHEFPTPYSVGINYILKK